MRVTLGAALLAATAPAALAHPGEAHATASTAWGPDPFAVVALLLSAALYGIGAWRLRRRAGRAGLKGWEIGTFAAAWCALALVLVSPLERLTETLFSWHMAQHEVLMLVAAPLAVMGRPLVAMIWALPARWRLAGGSAAARPLRVTWRALTGPLTVWVLHLVALWGWHIPALFNAAVRHDGVHFLQHLSFFGTAALFWWALVHGRYGRLGYGIAVLYVFTTAMHSAILGALLTLAPRVIYQVYDVPVAPTAAAALEDQQAAGLLMWVPSNLVFIGIGLALFAAWLSESDRRLAIGAPALAPGQADRTGKTGRTR